MPPDHRALEPPQGPCSYADHLAWFDPGLGRERAIGVDELLDAAEIGEQGGLVADREPAGDRVGGEGGAALVVVDP